MRRALKPFSSQTPGEKLGMLDGTNLFFGALLGANLGTAGSLPLVQYALLIVLLAGTVVALRQFSTSERTLYRWGLLGAYAALFAYLLYGKNIFEGMDAGDRDRLAITLAVWLGVVLLAEFTPVRRETGPDQAG